MNLLEIKHLCVSFKHFSPVRKISLAVKSGEFVALVGDSGSGKSTVALSVLRLQENTRIGGEILFKGKNLLAWSEKDMRSIRGGKIGMIFQEPMTSLNPLHKAGKQILESLTLHTKNPSRKKVIELLKLVGLKDVSRVYEAYPHELSGGQRQRIMIAMALAGKPDLLIADEPTTALDVRVQAQILALLKQLQQKLGLAILFITHDLEIVRKMADRVYVMRSGHIVSTKIPPAKKLFYKPTLKEAADNLLDVQNLNVFYKNFQAGRDISFTIHEKETVSLVGESGSGKSSVAKALMRLVKADGQVCLNGQDVFSLSGKKLLRARQQMQLVFQDAASSLNPRMMIADIIAEGARLHREVAPEEIEETLTSVRLKPDILTRYPHEISGGQRTRVALARALILKPELLILDEVTSSLDIHTQEKLLQLLSQLQQEHHLSYLFISHDMRSVKIFSDRVLIMQNGRIIESGTTRKIFQTPQMPYTKSLIKSSFVD